MKIAIISDIHGNLPALQAVLQDIAVRDVAKILCLGDVIGKGPSSAEALDICRDCCETIVAGNWDKYLANTDNDEPSVAYYKEQLGPARLEYLRSLPEFIEFYLSGKVVRLFHAHPLDVFTRVYFKSELEEKIGMFVQPQLAGDAAIAGPSDIVGYGDIHWAYKQYVGGKLLFNVGSVGNPLDIPSASYAILEGEYGNREPAPFAIQFYRVPYDIELAVRLTERGKPPQKDALIYELRTAIYSRT